MRGSLHTLRYIPPRLSVLTYHAPQRFAKGGRAQRVPEAARNCSSLRSTDALEIEFADVLAIEYLGRPQQDFTRTYSDVCEAADFVFAGCQLSITQQLGRVDR